MKNITILIIILFLSISIAHANQQIDKEYQSPNGKYIAQVIALPKTPYGSGESKIVIKTVKDNLLCSKSYSSEDGEHGFGVEQAAWTSDSQFFVYSMTSSGGHQAWHFPTYFISIQDYKVYRLDDYLGPITKADFELKSPNIIKTVGRQKETLDETIFEISLNEVLSKSKEKK